MIKVECYSGYKFNERPMSMLGMDDIESFGDSTGELSLTPPSNVSSQA